MKFLKKILFFFSLFLLYLILKEFLLLYNQVKEIHPYAGYGILLLSLGIFVYFVFLPVIKILSLPRNLGPAWNVEQEKRLIKERIYRYRDNPYLINSGEILTDIEPTRENYLRLTKLLEQECSRLRKLSVSQLFYTTSIAQNGFLDAILILSASINHVKDIFILFNGRVSNRDLWIIAQKIYYSVAIGGSEGVEYATEEIFSKFASDSMKSIPFIDKILTSLADGLVNATLLTRISIITENYCKMTLIKSNRDLIPSPKFIVNSASSITGDMIDRIFKTMRKLALKFAINKTFDYALIAINPLGYVVGKTIEKSHRIEPEKKERLMEHARLVGNPLAYGLEKLIHSLRKKK